MYELAEVCDIEAATLPITNAIVERKYDGHAVLVELNDGTAEMCSRSGRLMDRPDWLREIGQQWRGKTVLHCELVAGDDSTPGKVAKKDSDKQLIVHDVLFINGVDVRNDSFDRRKDDRALIVTLINDSRVMEPETDQFFCFTEETVADFKRFSKAAGIEGFVVKDPEALYSDGVCGYKVKAVDTLDGIVELIRTSGKRKAMGVSLYKDGPVVAWVPAGKVADEVDIGRVVEFTHIGFGSTPMRSCQFVRWRDDKTTEMCKDSKF